MEDCPTCLYVVRCFALEALCTRCHLVAGSVEMLESLILDAGWALCGHEAPTGTAPDESAGAEPEPLATSTFKSQKGRSKKQREAAARLRALAVLQQQKLVTSETVGPRQDTAAEPSSRPEQGEGERGVPGQEESNAVPPKRGDGPGELETEGDRFPAADIPREARILAGQLCKRLIDHCRAEYLRQLGFQVGLIHTIYMCSWTVKRSHLLAVSTPCAVQRNRFRMHTEVQLNSDICLSLQVEVVLYVPDAISGENRLILAAPQGHLL